MLRLMHDVIPCVARSLPCATAATLVLALHAQAFPIGSCPGEAGVRRWVYKHRVAGCGLVRAGRDCRCALTLVFCLVSVLGTGVGEFGEC